MHLPEKTSLEAYALFAWGVLKLPYEMLKDEVAFRRIGKLALGGGDEC